VVTLDIENAKIQAKAADEALSRGEFVYPNTPTVTANPVVTLPMGKSQEGLPIGVQVHGKPWSDARKLDIAELIVEIIGGFEKPSGF